MSDPLADIVPGSDVRPLLKSTARHNLISDAVRWVQAQRHGARPGTGYSFTDHCLLHVQNASGEKRTKGEVLAIDGLAVTPDDNLDGFLAHPVLKGVKPADEHVGKFVVLQSSAEPLEVVMGLLIGVTVAKLNVNSEDDEYADIAADSYELSTGGSGAAEIIAKQSGTGSKWGVVRIGGSSQAVRYGTMNDDFTTGGTVSCRWKKQDPETGKATVDSGEDFDVVDVFDWWPDAKAGTKIKAVKFGSVWAMDDMNCEESL